MAKRPRRDHAVAFKAKVALAAIRTAAIGRIANHNASRSGFCVSPAAVRCPPSCSTANARSSSEDVIAFYDRGGGPNPGLDPDSSPTLLRLPRLRARQS